jgi:hypothetical protein
MSNKNVKKLAPADCDLCVRPIKKVFYDARMRASHGGHWGNFCPECFEGTCVGTGSGVGQRFVQVEPGDVYFQKTSSDKLELNPKSRDILDELGIC